ncbi:hypothetical protein BC940DRAFT_303165 [Gongronella butleri]|nr:hypothetical protein BC940DRAFT_303165 [Gongronella butleri]
MPVRKMSHTEGCDRPSSTATIVLLPPTQTCHLNLVVRLPRTTSFHVPLTHAQKIR